MSSPLVSVVTGTFNRIGYLQRMVASARASIPASIGLVITVVDGGSTDGTLEWLRQQSDVRLIEHGALLGAMKAFCDGARASTEPFVLMANDDIEFIGDSILRALVYLEKTPTCACVAFEDNRPAPGYNAVDYKVQSIAAVDATGNPVHVPYAQVGLFRKELGELVGWWGDQDSVMGRARTYGGDSYLSARLWELGYTVDQVPGVRINDYIPQDDLRARNQANPRGGQHPDSAAYYERYPRGPQLPADLQTVNTPERLRVLYLTIYEPGPVHAMHRKNKRGLREAMQRRGFLVYEWDYATDPGDLVQMVKAFEPHLLLTQFQGVSTITPQILADARKTKPDMGVINWNGDAHMENLTGETVLKLLRHVDLQLTVNAASLPYYDKLGIPAAYWQIGYEESAVDLPAMPAHDVVFLGNCYNEQRREMEIIMKRKVEGINWGFYGRGWLNEAGDTLYDFAAGEALYRNAKIALADAFPGEQTAFVSNRTIQALAAGAFLLQQKVEGLEEYTGLRAGTHYIQWRDFRHLQTLVKYWLRPENESERRRIAEAGRAFVRERYSFDALLDKLFDEILPKVFTYEPA